MSNTSEERRASWFKQQRKRLRARLYGALSRDPRIRNFDADFYLQRYPDVRSALDQGALASALDHYLRFGRHERRISNSKHIFEGPNRSADEFPVASVAQVAMLEEKIRPVQVRVNDRSLPRANVFVPTLDLSIFFGGYIAFFHFLSRLSEAGVRLRFVVMEDAKSSQSWFLSGIRDRPRWMTAFSSAEFVNLAQGKSVLEISRNDACIAYSCWTAYAASSVSAATNNPKFGFFIQEYEPAFHAYDLLHFLTTAAYDLPHVAIFNTSTLKNYFKKHKIGVFQNAASSALSFEHAIQTVKQRERGASRKLIFYARPEAHAEGICLKWA